MWQAIPLPEGILQADTLTIDLSAVTQPVTLRGDYTNNETYTGPLLSPWYTGHSFWRWQWNGLDPRIPAATTLNGDYESLRITENGVISSDLSSEIGRQSGLYRVFVVQAAFGQNTNAFGAPGAPNADTLCGENHLLMAPGTTVFYICRRDDGTITYHEGDALLGDSPPALFTDILPENTLIHEIDHENGSIDVIQVMKNLFVANFYDADANLIYAMVFNAP